MIVNFLTVLGVWWVSWVRVQATLEVPSSEAGSRDLQVLHWPQQPPYGHVPNPAGAVRLAESGRGAIRQNTRPAALKGASPAALNAMRNWERSPRSPWVWNSSKSRYEIAEPLKAEAFVTNRGAASAVVSAVGDSAQAVSGNEPASNIVGSVGSLAGDAQSEENESGGGEGTSSAATAGIAIGAAGGGLVLAGGAGAIFALTRKGKRGDEEEDPETPAGHSDYEDDEFTTEGSDSLDESDKFEVDADISFWSKQADFAAF